MAQEFTLLSVAARNVKRKPLRTTILIVAIGLLVALLVFALSFIRRVDSSIRLASERLGADLLILPTGSRGAAEDFLLENEVKSFLMDRAVIERIRKIDGIAAVSPQIYLTTIAGVCCDVPDAVVIAFDQETDFVVNPWLPKKLGRRLQKGEAIVGSESAFNIDIGAMEVDSILFGSIFKMVGVLEKTGTGLDYAIFIDQANIDDILKQGKAKIRPGEISIVFAKVKKGQDPRKVAGLIEDSIIEVDAVARKDLGKGVLDTLADINRVFSVTVVLAAVLSVFLAWAVFSAVANERAREVGIMRAIGARESQVVKLFLIEILIIGGIGSIAGIGAGTSLSMLLAKGFSIMKHVTTDLGSLERAAIALFGLLIGTGVCVVGAVAPLQRLKRMEPLAAMKGE
ncbi:MAG: ABC transporter permease [Nitrospirota bacterium]